MQTDLHPTNPHKEMQQIIEKSLTGEASPQEQQTLRKHLLACDACQKYASDSRRAIVGLNGFSFAASPDLQAKVHASLALRAQQLEAAQPNHQRIVRVSILAILLTVVGSFAALNLGNPLAAFLHLEPVAAQTGVVALWIFPSLCFALFVPVLLLFRARSTNAKGSAL